MKIAKETIILAVLGVADLVTTMIWVAHHAAQEANPLFAHYLRMGPMWFALMKLLLLAAPLFVLEWARRHRPAFTVWASRAAIVGYLGMYAVGVYHANSADIQDYYKAQAQLARSDAQLAAFLSDHPAPQHRAMPSLAAPAVYALRAAPAAAGVDVANGR